MGRSDGLDEMDGEPSDEVDDADKHRHEHGDHDG